LLTALEIHGRDLDDERREESHPVVTPIVKRGNR